MVWCIIVWRIFLKNKYNYKSLKNSILIVLYVIHTSLQTTLETKSKKFLQNILTTTYFVVEIYYNISRNKRRQIKTEEDFRTDRATRILMLYHQMLSGQKIDKLTYTLEHNVDERTFDRDIGAIRTFLSDIFSNEQLLFDRASNTYYLSGKRPVYIDRMDAAVISKILLESRLLRKDEMLGLLNVLLSSVDQHNAKIIKKYLNYDICEYESETNNAILKFVEDLFAVLESGRDIEIQTQGNSGKPDINNVSPLKISCEQNGFYLIAAQDFSLTKIRKIAIDKIISFKKLQTIFAVNLKEKYYKNKEG